MIIMIIIITLLINAIHYAFQEGEIFGFVNNWTWPDWLKEPLFGCNVCMSPWHGTWLYWLLYGNSWQEWLIVIFCVMGLNAAINKLSPDK